MEEGDNFPALNQSGGFHLLTGNSTLENLSCRLNPNKCFSKGPSLKESFHSVNTLLFGLHFEWTSCALLPLSCCCPIFFAAPEIKRALFQRETFMHIEDKCSMKKLLSAYFFSSFFFPIFLQYFWAGVA